LKKVEDVKNFFFIYNLILVICTFAGRFHATRGVHSVAKETIPGHLAADDPSHNGPGMGPASYLQPFAGTFGHLEHGRRWRSRTRVCHLGGTRNRRAVL